MLSSKLSFDLSLAGALKPCEIPIRSAFLKIM